MSEKKYYVKLKSPNNHRGVWWCGDRAEWQSYSDDPVYGEELDDWGEREVIGWKVSEFIPSFTKSELGKIMDGILYRTFTHQFNPELAEELYKLGYKTTQTTEEWIEARYEFDNIWEWINPLIELVPVEDGK